MEEVLKKFQNLDKGNRLAFYPRLVTRAWLRRNYFRGVVHGKNIPLTAAITPPPTTTTSTNAEEDHSSSFFVIRNGLNGRPYYHYFPPDLVELDSFLDQLRSCPAPTVIWINPNDGRLEAQQQQKQQEVEEVEEVEEKVDEEEENQSPLLRFGRRIQHHGTLIASRGGLIDLPEEEGEQEQKEQPMIRFMRSIQQQGTMVSLGLDITQDRIGPYESSSSSSSSSDLIDATRSLIDASQNFRTLTLRIDCNRRRTIGQQEEEDQTSTNCCRSTEALIAHCSPVKRVRIDVQNSEAAEDYSLEDWQILLNQWKGVARGLTQLPNVRALEVSTLGQSGGPKPWLHSTNPIPVIFRRCGLLVNNTSTPPPPLKHLTVHKNEFRRLEDCHVLANAICTSSLRSLTLKDIAFLQNDGGEETQFFRVLLKGIGNASCLNSLHLQFRQMLSLESSLSLYAFLVRKKNLKVFVLNQGDQVLPPRRHRHRHRHRNFYRRAPPTRLDEAERPNYAAHVVAMWLGQRDAKHIRHLALPSVQMEDAGGGADLEDSLPKMKQYHSFLKSTTAMMTTAAAATTTTTMAEGSTTIGMDLVKSLQYNKSLLHLDLSGSEMTVQTLRKIADSLMHRNNQKCTLETLDLSKLDVLRDGNNSKEEMLLILTEIALQLALDCPSLTKISTSSIDRHGRRHRRHQAHLDNGFPTRQSILQVAIEANKSILEAQLLFNLQCKKLLSTPNGEYAKENIVAVLTNFKEEPNVLFRALKMFPVLFT